MCGLAGVLIGDSADQTAIEKIKELFTANLAANEERGKEATGASVLLDDGSFFIEKAPIRATEFIKTRSYLDFIEKKVRPGARVILGHTRLPTKGSPNVYANNHPIRIGDIVGVHNGTITNDDQIFLDMDRRKDKNRKRIGSVDSEAIFALMDAIDPHLSFKKYVDAIQNAASLLVGTYTTLFFNRKWPHKLFLLKYNNPISVHYAPALNALFFSSRYVFLRKAFGKSVITAALPSETGYVYDSRLLEGLKKEPLRHFELKSKELVVPCALENIHRC